MAKKQEINQSAEIRSILEQLGKDATFKDAFEKLQARHKGRTFNENSCQQAFTLARKKLGFAKGPKSKRVAVRKTRGNEGGGGRGGGRVGKSVVGIEMQVLAVIRAAKQLIALTGDSEAAKAVIDHMYP